jgi:hypothetical protein
MPRSRTVTVYLVQHLEWEDTYEYHVSPEENAPLPDGMIPGITPVQTFLSRNKATALARDLERKARAGLNPFHFGGDGGWLGDFTTLTPEQFRAAVEALGVDPPRMDREGRGRLRQWWDDEIEELEEDQIHGIWDALDCIRFHTVFPCALDVDAMTERAALARVYLVERITWVVARACPVKEVPPLLEGPARTNPFKPGEFFLMFYKRARQGGMPVKAFLDAGAALAYCQQRERELRPRRNPFHYGERLSDWTSLDAGRLRDWMLDVGLDPPAVKAGRVRLVRKELDAWRAWYDRIRPALSEIQILKVWEALDQVRFYRFIELTE